MGFAVAVMAIGFAGQRHLLDSAPRTRIITPSVDRSAGSTTATAPSATVRRAPETGTAARARAGWQAFDTVVNVLNVVVGIAGIWMTIHGLRMQRLALAIERRQSRRRQAA